MKLTKFLRDQGFDLIEGPVRNHLPLQLWRKSMFDEVELYYDHISHAFTSSVSLQTTQKPSLDVNASKKDDYNFNIGITLLEETLKSLGMGTFKLSSKIKSGKKVTMSYDNAMTEECPIGKINDYLTSADFNHSNPALLKDLNRNHVLVVTGILFAKNLVVQIDTDFTVDANLVAELNNSAEGKLDFSMVSASSIKMVSTGGSFFPIAVKANRIDFDRGEFKKTTLVTDNRNFF